MRKIITLVATLAFVIALSMTAFAATNWKYDEATQVWSCTDKNGDAVTEQWVKSGDDWFWLDADGKMATAQLVDDGTALYCVDEKGQMIKNNWVKVNDDNFDNKWLYFGVNGKAYENGWKTIKNEKYHFTEKAMDQGFLDNTDSAIDADVEQPWKTAQCYVGEDGAMKKNYWLEVEDFDAANGKGWVFFGANGKKVTDCKKTINGSTYVFDAEGKMVTSFPDATVSSASLSVYMDADGKMLKKSWVFAFLTEDADEQNWFYADGKGELAKSVVKTINDKKYAFDADGKMLTGFVEVSEDGKTVIGNKSYAAEDVTFAAATSDLDEKTFMYFTESATPSEQGPAVKGKTTIACQDAKLTINFSSRGLAKGSDGKFTVKNNYAYKNSVLCAIEEPEVKYAPILVDGTEYVWTTKSGRVAKKGTFTDSDNEYQFKFDTAGKLHKYTKDAKGKYTVEDTTWTYVD